MREPPLYLFFFMDLQFIYILMNFYMFVPCNHHPNQLYFHDLRFPCATFQSIPPIPAPDNHACSRTWHKWNYMFSFASTFFSVQDITCEIHSYCSVSSCFFFNFYCWAIYHYMNILLFCPFSSWWIFVLFSDLELLQIVLLCLLVDRSTHYSWICTQEYYHPF